MTVRLAVSRSFASEGRRVRLALEAAGLAVERGIATDGAEVTLRSAEGCLDRLPSASQGAVIGLAEPRDALVVGPDASGTLAGLPAGARVALEGRLRRELLGVHRPDVVPVEEPDAEAALSLLADGEIHGWIAPVPLIRAAGAADRIAEVLEPTSWTSAPGRGALLLEHAGAQDRVLDVLRALDERPARRALLAEAATLRALGVGTDATLGVSARPHGPLLRIRAVVPAASGRRLVRAELSGRLEDPETAGQRVAEQLVARGALELLSAGTAAAS